MIETQYNPDVLSCLANLSNDEVFTPPSLVNEILDLLPPELWKSPNAKFLDPGCKSGVFLREMAKRLMKGLEKKIPNKQERINHIFSKQLYGIAITELTALLCRRSVYCSKTANGKYSICEDFKSEQGNIYFKRIYHTWNDGKCIYCGASQEAYDREDALETHAYNFIHTEEPEKIFDMKFDVIVGNPPYQLGSDGGTRDIPIYNKFVEQAKKLNPRFLCMIIPSRWMASGLGLSEFRKNMLEDKRIRKLVDYPVANEVFAGVEIKGGVCYFLWSRDSKGTCEVISIRGGEVFGPVERNLNEFDVFVRDSRAVEILRKILSFNETSITEILSVDKEFGWTSNFSGFHQKEKKGDVPLYYIKKGKRDIGWIGRSEVTKSIELIDKWKVMIPQAGSDGGKKIPDSVLGKPLIAPSPSVCTQSYLFFFVDTESQAKSIESYLRTRFFRFLVSLRKITQHATRSTYTWVPKQKWSGTWTDEKLYKKYELTQEEITFIEKMITPMSFSLKENNNE
ncbi:Eco57I restriction-modification methylase domain-containing protein [Aridibaculum aurantiacum]|uniref:Eco57I restriction-modification methylase domain-containing protein n=1 Tax=Aridibaculum aurantiacum TaxID=2810307 RepID=UPI001A96C752|nr:Eco57I restriction-modification methylase domain-containing protein [Aridibaculum aurantiacum]